MSLPAQELQLIWQTLANLHFGWSKFNTHKPYLEPESLYWRWNFLPKQADDNKSAQGKSIEFMDGAWTESGCEYLTLWQATQLNLVEAKSCLSGGNFSLAFFLSLSLFFFPQDGQKAHFHPTLLFSSLPGSFQKKLSIQLNSCCVSATSWKEWRENVWKEREEPTRALLAEPSQYKQATTASLLHAPTTNHKDGQEKRKSFSWLWLGQQKSSLVDDSSMSSLVLLRSSSSLR